MVYACGCAISRRSGVGMTTGLARRSLQAPTITAESRASDESLLRAQGLSRMRKFLERKFKDPAAILDSLGDSEYELRKCCRCTLIYQRNVLTDEYSKL